MSETPLPLPGLACKPRQLEPPQQLEPPRRLRLGFTLTELLVVVAVLAALAMMALPRFDRTQDRAAGTTTDASLVAIRLAIAGKGDSPGFFDDLRELPGTLADLYLQPLVLPSGRPVFPYDPVTRRGWEGPYLTPAPGVYEVVPARGFFSAYGQQGDPAPLDAWRHPIVLQWPTVGGLPIEELQIHTRLVSAGPDGILDTSPDTLAPDPSNPSQVGDDVVLYLLR